MSDSASLAAELHAVLDSAGADILHDRALLRAAGPDASRWLNGMTTNSVQALAPGDGAYSFFLNAQGRIQGDATIYREPVREGGPGSTEDASFLILTTSAQAETLHPMLDRFIIMDDVELAPATGERSVLLLVGPKAGETLSAILPGVAAPQPLQLLDAGDDLLLVTPAPSILPRFELLGAPDRIAALFAAAQQHGASPMHPETLETLRLLAATPSFGTDIRDRDLPQETAQTHALHFSKGCYLGQEIVERIRSRGQVHRQLTAFRLDGPLPQVLPAALEANGKAAGELTSAAIAPLPGGPAILALGYARREFLEANAPLRYASGTAVPRKPGVTA